MHELDHMILSHSFWMLYFVLTTILQPVEQKPRSQKDRQDEKAEGSVPDKEKKEQGRATYIGLEKCWRHLQQNKAKY